MSASEQARRFHSALILLRGPILLAGADGHDRGDPSWPRVPVRSPSATLGLARAATVPTPHQPSFRLTPPANARSQMCVTKRSGSLESVDVNKIVRAVTRCCEGLSDVDPMRVALKTIAGLYEGATTRELYQPFSGLDYIASSPTLFNAGSRHEQLSSCFLLDSPQA